MSGASGSGATPPSGVVQNSVLSFVASAQVMHTSENDNAAALPSSNLQEALQQSNDEGSQADRLVPPGLKALCEACCKMYPDQPNPLQVTTRLKYWLGGEDPLDYISMYWSPGRPEENIPPHWHYISFGLSDLHGDGRVHGTGGPDSGYGFELTFRLESAEAQPPLWPAQLCQALARYVFTTGNKLCAGDHISWHRDLEGSARGRLRHLLVAKDATLRPIHTPHGRVDFLQIVGCTGRELKAAQRGSGFEVLKLIGEDPNCGGPWLVTRPRRRRSARRVTLEAPKKGPVHSPLAGVSARLCWAPTQAPDAEPATASAELPAAPDAEPATASPSAEFPPGIEQQIRDTLQRGLSAMSSDSVKLPSEPGKMSTDSFEMSSIERALPQIPETLNDSWAGDGTVQYFDGAHIVMNAEGASLLPLAIDSRVRMGGHFTWRCGEAAVTFCAARVRGALPTARRRLAARGLWLQVLITDSQAASLSALVAPLGSLCASDSESDAGAEPARAASAPELPLTLSTEGLLITVLPDEHFL